MVYKALILGDSGTGKSRAMKSLDPNKTFLISPDMKTIPIKGANSIYKTVLKDNDKIDLEKTNYYKTRNPKTVLQLLKAVSDKRPDIEVIVIDTITMLMFGEFMRTIKEKGFEKFNNLADDIWDILKEIDNLRDNLSVIVIGHTDIAYDDMGVLRRSSRIPSGKILKEKISLEEVFDVVLYTDVNADSDGREYFFHTQNNGKNTCKSPEGMFEEDKIPNDYSIVIEKMKQYYN